MRKPIMTKPLYIFDLDGTLALIDHRRHYVERPACPLCGWVKPCDHNRVLEEQYEMGVPKPGIRPPFIADWPAFFAACVDDIPNKPVIEVMKSLLSRRREVDFWFFSVFFLKVRATTEKGLNKHTPFCFN